MSKQSVIGLIHALSYRKVHDKNLWSVLIRGVLLHLEEFDYSEIAGVMKDLNNIKIKSSVFYERIAQRVLDAQFLEQSIDKSDEVYFFLSLFILHGEINN